MQKTPIKIGPQKDIDFIDNGTSIEIVIYPYSIGRILFHLFMSIFLSGYILIFSAVFMSAFSPFGIKSFQEFHSRHESLFIFSIFLCIFIISIIIFYYHLNRKHIFVDSDYILVRHRPLPWFGDKDIKSQEIARTFAVSVPRSGIDQYGNREPENQLVCGVKIDGKTVKIVQNIDSDEDTKVVAEKIERFLLRQKVSH